MIVLDTSALLELLLATSAGRLIAERIESASEGLHVPHFADLEIMQTPRRYLRDCEIDVGVPDRA